MIGGDNPKYDKLCSKRYAYNWAESFANGNSTVIFNYWVISWDIHNVCILMSGCQNQFEFGCEDKKIWTSINRLPTGYFIW